MMINNHETAILVFPFMKGAALINDFVLSGIWRLMIANNDETPMQVS